MELLRGCEMVLEEPADHVFFLRMETRSVE